MTYRKALGSGVFFSDRKRNRLKSLDEYYKIRANIPSDTVPEEIKIQSKPREQKNEHWLLTMFIVFFLLITWFYLIAKVTSGDGAIHLLHFEQILSPFAWATSRIWQMVLFPVTVPMTVYNFMSSHTRKTMHSFFPHTEHAQKVAFIGRRDNPELNDMISHLAVGRDSRHMMIQRNIAYSSVTLLDEDITKLNVFDSTAKGLFKLAALVDDGYNAHLTIATQNEIEQTNLIGPGESNLGQNAEENLNDKN